MSLNPRHEKFCRLYAGSQEHFGNATSAYIAAYRIDPTDTKKTESARRSASDLLTKPDILARCDEVLAGLLTNDKADAELAYVLIQRDNLPAQIAAIKEHNALKQRVKTKVEVEFSKEAKEALERLAQILLQHHQATFDCRQRRGGAPDPDVAAARAAWWSYRVIGQTRLALLVVRGFGTFAVFFEPGVIQVVEVRLNVIRIGIDIGEKEVVDAGLPALQLLDQPENERWPMMVVLLETQPPRAARGISWNDIGTPPFSVTMWTGPGMVRLWGACSADDSRDAGSGGGSSDRSVESSASCPR